MITCPNCGNEQTAKNFCGKCGSSLKELQNTTVEQVSEPVVPTPAQPAYTNTQQPTEPVQPTYTNTQQAAQPVKPAKPQMESLTNFWKYFVSKLKNPSKTENEGEFQFGLILNIIAVFLWAVIPFALIRKGMSAIDNRINSIDDEFGDLFNDASTSSYVNFGLGAFIKILLYMGVFYALTALLVLFLSKQLGSLKSWKIGIVRFGALNSWMALAFIIVLALVLFDSLIFATMLFFIFTFIFVFLVPLYTATTFYKEKHRIDSFVRYLMTMVSLFVLYAILYAISFDKLVNYIDELTSLI